MTSATHRFGSYARSLGCKTTIYRRPRDLRWASSWNNTDHESWPSNPTPTPYDVLGCSKKGQFSKAHFYKLVKRYHPDMFPKAASEIIDPWHKLPEDIRKERFRLILLAKEILSSPQKKSAYDTLGIGWVHANRPQEVYGGAEGYGTGGRYDSSWCATWEDWEEFRARRDGTQKKPELLMAHWKFTGIAVILSCIGGLLSLGIARNSARKRAEFQDKISAELEDVIMALKNNPIRVGGEHGKAQALERLRGGGVGLTATKSRVESTDAESAASVVG